MVMHTLSPLPYISIALFKMISFSILLYYRVLQEADVGKLLSIKLNHEQQHQEFFRFYNAFRG
jgi:hypothetical protein